MKFFCVIISLLVLCSCSNYVFYEEKINQQASNSIIIDTLEKEDFVKFYDKEPLSLYSDDKTQTIIIEIQNQEKEIYNLEKADFLNIIGTPYLIKNEIVIELWQYRSPFCILNVFWNNSKSEIADIYSYNHDLKEVDSNECLENTIKLNTN